MKNTMTKLMWVLGTLLLPLTASAAPGMLPGADTLPQEFLDTVQDQVEEARLQHPDHFAAVQRIVREAPELDRKKRGRLAPFPAMLKRLGTEADAAMLEVLLLNGPDHSDWKETARIGLRAGLIEALGFHQNENLIVPLAAVLNGPETEHYLVRGAAEALGFVRTDQAMKVLLDAAQAAGPNQVSIWAGMGSCRRAEVATYLAEALAATEAPDVKAVLVKSLRSVANEYAWKTPSAQVYAQEELPVREIAAQSLLDLYTALPAGELRNHTLKGLVIVGHPQTRAWIDAALPQAGTTQREALTVLRDRLR